MAAYKDILFDVKDRIATLTINLPESRNPISQLQTIEEIEDACRQVKMSDTVSVLILTGAGRAFSAGGNIKNMKARTETSNLAIKVADTQYRRGIQRIPMALDALDVPVIAAINGPAIGAGCDMAMMADIRIASTQAMFG